MGTPPLLAEEQRDLEKERAARAAARRLRMTARIEREGCAELPADLNPSGAAGVELAYRLTLSTYALLGKPITRIPRAEWPALIRRPDSP
ncbi:MAG: hypothetical protein ACI9KE_005961 [Polyangiales bacterium]|jgi:hypothetical protein